MHSVDCQKKEIGALCITLAFWKADHLKISRSETLACRQRFKRDTNHFLIPQTPLRSNTKYTTVHGDIFCWVFLHSQICTGPESIFKPFVPFLKNKIVFRTRKTQAKGRSNLICHSREQFPYFKSIGISSYQVTGRQRSQSIHFDSWQARDKQQSKDIPDWLLCWCFQALLRV